MKNIKRMRTISLNERGQIVIPEDIRKDFGMDRDTTLVLIERENEIVLRMENDVLKILDGEHSFWRKLQGEAIKNAWSKEDEIWDKVFNKLNK